MIARIIFLLCTAFFVPVQAWACLPVPMRPGQLEKTVADTYFIGKVRTLSATNHYQDCSLEVADESGFNKCEVERALASYQILKVQIVQSYKGPEEGIIEVRQLLHGCDYLPRDKTKAIYEDFIVKQGDHYRTVSMDMRWKLEKYWPQWREAARPSNMLAQERDKCEAEGGKFVESDWRNLRINECLKDGK